MKPWTLPVVAILITPVGVTEVQAFDQAQYQALTSGQKDCQMCDLSDANLTKADLRGANLWAANLTDANLAEAWCNYSTKLPAGSGWSCASVVMQRK